LFAVMVVDDDPKIREWFEVEIEWGKMGFDFICSAKDGIDALNKLNQHNKLDLVISDIDIPKMNGIELLNSIKEYNLSSMIVLLSDENNMAHVKQGLLLGAFDYILKPLDKDKVIDVLKKAHDSLMDKKMEEERNKNLKKKLELNLSLSRDKILQDLLRGKEFPFQELDYIQNEYNISLQKGMVQVGIIEIGNFDADSRELIKSGRFDSLVEEVGKIISNTLSEFPELNCNMVEMDIGLISVILQPVGQKELQDFEDMTADFFEKVLKGIKQDANMRATIGIGGAYSSLRDISQSYMGAKAALRHKFIWAATELFI